jgi:hypothetical protein
MAQIERLAGFNQMEKPRFIDILRLGTVDISPMMGQAIDFVIELSKMSVSQQKEQGFDTEEMYKLYVEKSLMPIFELSAGQETLLETILKDF